MSDLISRSMYKSKLLKALDVLNKEYREAILNEDNDLILAIQNQQSAYMVDLILLDNEPTAYSVDKVVAELERIRAKETCNKEKCDSKELCGICVVDDAIEIVKHGGVVTEKETIRDKAIKWNNNSSKRVPYEFIEFVEGKRDIGVTDDVCEWKKCSSGSVDFYVYSSKCLPKNLKEIGTQTNFIDDFKYCPYCGKKIKVVK